MSALEISAMKMAASAEATTVPMRRGSDAADDRGGDDGEFEALRVVDWITRSGVA